MFNDYTLNRVAYALVRAFLYIAFACALLWLMQNGYEGPRLIASLALIFGGLEGIVRVFADAATGVPSEPKLPQRRRHASPRGGCPPFILLTPHQRPATR
ncbi:hypothetical protein [Hyphomicrobium sp. DY-1]|uniref:hypothetical protein n=1 Tax=Hyphomicrobium sp. DY-1 TaxID=3075650 RepID=UPI0039C0A300